MRYTSSICILTIASFALARAEQSGSGDTRPVTVEKFDFPKVTRVGEEFTLNVTLQNRYGRLAVANARLFATENCQILVPGDEQIIFLEKDSTRTVSWRLKRIGGGGSSFQVETTLLTDKRATGPPIPNPERDALHQTWSGLFTDRRGNVYQAELKLTIGPNGAAEGRIKWTLKKSPRKDYQDKIGRGGTEYVWGSYNAKARQLAISGYRRIDPHGVLGLDKYRLILGENNAVLGGITWDHGSWDGRLDLTVKGNANN